jgi:ferrous iron transport protein B
VPAILATRTMERQRDRTLTMMVIPLMTCSARLPVYTLIIATLFPPSKMFGVLPVQGLLMIAMYVFSTLTALVAAMVLSRTLFKGPAVPLILELPPYRMPHVPSVVRMMCLRTRSFLESAGTVILVCTIVLWALLSFPRRTEHAAGFGADRANVEASGAPAVERAERIAAIDRAEMERCAELRGRLGYAIEPAIDILRIRLEDRSRRSAPAAARSSSARWASSTASEARPTRNRPRCGEDPTETHADGRPVLAARRTSLMIFFSLACQYINARGGAARDEIVALAGFPVRVRARSPGSRASSCTRRRWLGPG